MSANFDRIPAQFPHASTNMVEDARIELMVSCMPSERSTTELIPHRILGPRPPVPVTVSTALGASAFYSTTGVVSRRGLRN